MIIGSMIDSLTIAGRSYTFDSSKPIDISIPMKFNGPQPNAYGVPPASSIPCETGDLVGDTRQGGSCNFEQYTVITHCNGTHTECVGHITNQRISVRDCLRDVLMPALLITVGAEAAGEPGETYSVPFEDGDRIISRRVIEQWLHASPGWSDASGSSSALIVRTLPNDQRKLTRQYLDVVPAFFTTEAIQFIVECGFRHLLTDLPSIDRLFDEGKLSNHRTFWNVEQGSFDANPQTRRGSTVTEFIYVPNDVEDGLYMMNLQIAPFDSDASPSRPILFRLNER